MKIKITYEELHKLLDNNVDVRVNTPTKKKKIISKFNKTDSGYLIKYNDLTETRCASSHYMQFNGDLISANMLRKGDICDFSNKIIESIERVPEQLWYDFEIDSNEGLYIQNNTIHHNSGKSLIIFMIMYFLYKKGKKGYLIVPNIGLLTQLYDDFGGYFTDEYSAERDEFLNCIDKQGGGHQSEFDSFLTISTWQSLATRKGVLDKADFILCDELHRYAADVSSEIVKATVNAKMRFGLTGTLPEDPMATMTLLGMFGAPKRYIRACELIERGLATPVEIISFIMKYSDEDKRLFNSLPKGQFAKQLAFIKEHDARHKFVIDVSCAIKESGNLIILGTHTEHIKLIFTDIMKRLYPDVIVENKNITGKKSFEFQKQYGVYFINGEDDANTRELTRKILEEKHYVIEFNDSKKITLSENDTFEDISIKDLIIDISLYIKYNIKNIILRTEILVSNYPIMSTGVNIKRLFNIIFACPLKAYTTITQSIGRGLRLHPDKKIFRVIDIVDDFGLRKPGGIFWKQYTERQRHSYNSEGYPITEKEYKL